MSFCETCGRKMLSCEGLSCLKCQVIYTRAPVVDDDGEPVELDDLEASYDRHTGLWLDTPRAVQSKK